MADREKPLPPDAPPFGRALRALRKLRGLNQTELARLIARRSDEQRMSQSSVSGWEQGQNVPTTATLRAAEEALGVKGLFEALHEPAFVTVPVDLLAPESMTAEQLVRTCEMYQEELERRAGETGALETALVASLRARASLLRGTKPGAAASREDVLQAVLEDVPPGVDRERLRRALEAWEKD